jgi:hypothetical protein
MVVNYKSCVTNTLSTIILDSVFVMNNITALEKLLSQNNGRITSKDVDHAGIHRMYLKRKVSK